MSIIKHHQTGDTLFALATAESLIRYSFKPTKQEVIRRSRLKSVGTILIRLRFFSVRRLVARATLT